MSLDPPQCPFSSTQLPRQSSLHWAAAAQNESVIGKVRRWRSAELQIFGALNSFNTYVSLLKLTTPWPSKSIVRRLQRQSLWANFCRSLQVSKNSFPSVCWVNQPDCRGDTAAPGASLEPLNGKQVFSPEVTSLSHLSPTLTYRYKVLCDTQFVS